MPTLGELANVTAGAASKPGAVSGAAAVRAIGLQPIQLYATMQGQRTLTEDLATISLIYLPMVQTITDYFGQLMALTAQYLHSPNIDTGDTYESIKSEFTPLPTGAKVEVSVGTDYAKFLEFGFVHHISGKWIYNPFMIPAADLIAPAYVDALNQVAQIVQGRRFLSGPAAASPASSILASARASLYSYSKFAGDIQVLGVGGLSKSRGLALKGAKGIGNVQAIQSGTLISRIGRVAFGQTLGRYGRGGLVSGFSPSASLSGPSARIYNRFAGRVFGGVLSGIKIGDL